MFGNIGEKWIQVNELEMNGLTLKDVGSEFEIKDYHSVPHGYASIEYNGVLLFIPDAVFEDHFIRLSEYKKYYQLGDSIMINANGNFSTYIIENITGAGHYITLELEQD